MRYEWFTALALAKLLLAFAFFFVYLPTKIFPQRREVPAIDRFVENLLLMTASTIVVVHLLVIFRIYSIVAVLVCCVALRSAINWYRDDASPLRRLRLGLVELMVLALDILDRVTDVRLHIRRWLADRRRGWQSLARNRVALVHVGLFGAVLLYAAILRYLDAFRSPAFGFSDPYSHLVWMKQLESGILFPAGPPERGFNPFYPKGFHSFLAILHSLTNLDGATALRLAGPLAGILLVVSVYYGARRLTGDGNTALVAMFVFGTFVEVIPWLDVHFLGKDKLEYLLAPPFLAGWFARQTTPLPEEFALVFLLPALFAAQAALVRSQHRRNLVLVGAAVLLVALTHSIVAALLAAGLGLLAVLAILVTGVFRPALRLLGVAGGAFILGSAPLAYGMIVAPSHMEGSRQQYQAWLTKWDSLGPLPYSLEIMISAALALVLIGCGLFHLRSRESALRWLFVGLYLAGLTFAGRSLNFGFQYLLPLDRIANARVMLVSVAVAGVLYFVTLAARPRWSWHLAARQAMTVGALVILGVIGAPSEIPEPPRYEYSGFPSVLHQIRKTHHPLSWTVVSNIEGFSQIYRDGGWHLNAQDFLAAYSPGGTLDIPTPYVFLFVEKTPFLASSNPEITRSGHADIARRMREWAALYGVTHDDAAIYYEDQQVLVYRIARETTVETRNGALRQIRRSDTM